MEERSIFCYKNNNRRVHRANISGFNQEDFEKRLQECIESGGKLLDLSNLGLTFLPKNLPLTLEHLSISDNNIAKLPNLKYLNRLKIFDCCGNKLRSIEGIPYVHELNCRHNYLDDIKNLEGNNFLERLDVTDNNISVLPKIASLVILECSKNRLRAVCNYKNMKRLIAVDNKIALVENLPKLQVMDITNNRVEKLPNFDKMEHLTCDNNHLTKIEGYRKALFMSFAGNEIKFLPFIKKLREVVCDYTDMSLDTRYKITSHEVTTLKKNKISTITFNPK